MRPSVGPSDMIRFTLRKAVGLLVDDGTLAALVVAWLLVCALVLPRLHGGLGGVVLFAGLAAILIDNVVRRARR